MRAETSSRVPDGAEADSASRAIAVPVLRPMLPPADRLLPYLRRMDAARWYSNHGPLVAELESRLAGLFAMPNGAVVTAASCTAALAGAILGLVGRARAERPLALLPAYTFVGTAAAVEQCGYSVHLADIDPDSWMLDPERVADLPILAKVGVVVPVAPYGRAVPQAPWRAFRARTGVPVIIDGAASLEALAAEPGRYLGDCPVALSFHATKTFATGEGGAVVAPDPVLARRAGQALNFGFDGDRNSRLASLNGKMSEYHAAVGLAELDGFDAKVAQFRRVAGQYRDGLALYGLAKHLWAAPDIAACYNIYQAADVTEAAAIQDSFRRNAIDFRLWYGGGLHRHDHLATAPRQELIVTEELAPCLIGLPTTLDETPATLARIVDALAEGVGR